ncbi:MAG: hypothetical protein ACOYLS_13190 [Polymorphobacter sp.]
MFAIWALLFTSLLVIPFVTLLFSLFVDEGTLPIVQLLLAYCALAWAVLVAFFGAAPAQKPGRWDVLRWQSPRTAWLL